MLIENSMIINDGQPKYCVDRAMHILNKHKKAINGAKILVCGVAYKQDIDDYRESSAIQVIEELKKVNAIVDYYDPYISEYRKNGDFIKGIKLISPEVISVYDLVIITTAHTNVDYKMITDNAQAVFDTKNIRNVGNVERL